jgi:mannose-6-phosphate isomerase-like protein (cupin superfamily)
MEDISKYFADDTSVQSSNEEQAQDTPTDSPRFQIVVEESTEGGQSRTNSNVESMELDSVESRRRTAVFRDPAVQKINFASAQKSRTTDTLRNLDENRSIGSSGSENDMKAKTPVVKTQASVAIPSARRFMKFSDTPARPRISKKKSSGLPSVSSRFSEIMKDDEDEDSDEPSYESQFQVQGNSATYSNAQESGIISDDGESKLADNDDQSEPNNTFSQPMLNQDIDDDSMPSDYDASDDIQVSNSEPQPPEYGYSDEPGEFGADNMNDNYDDFELSDENNTNIQEVDTRGSGRYQSSIADISHESSVYHKKSPKVIKKSAISRRYSPSLSPEPSLIQDESLDVDEPQTDFDDTTYGNDLTYINQSHFDSDDGSVVGDFINEISMRGGAVGDNSFQITGVRRSKRVKVPPLAYWRNERIVYNLEEERPHIKEIVYAPVPVKTERKKRRKPVQKASRPSQKRRIEESSDESGNEGDVAGKVDGLVFDYPDMNQSSTRVIAWAANAGDFKDIKNAAYSLATLYDYNSSYCAGGIIDIKVNGSKPLKPSKQNSYIFYVISGRVEVNVSDTIFTLRKGGSFEVPRGNYYSITNADPERDAKLFFVQATDTLENEKES